MDKRRKTLAQAFLALESEEELNALLGDLCTIKEVEDMAHRFEIAILLFQGKTFMDIEKLTGVSSATISRVNRSLKYGSGYRKIIEKLLKTEDLSE